MAKAKKVLKRCQTCGAGFRGRPGEPETLCAAHRPRVYRGEEEGAQTPGSSATSWVPHAKLKLADRVDQWLFAHDAANECVHGALPHDRKIPAGCACWGERYVFEEQELVKPPVKKRTRKVA